MASPEEQRTSKQEPSVLLAVGLFVAAFVMGLAVFVGLVVALPAGYFTNDHRFGTVRNPVVRWSAIVAKNLLGLAIIVLGVALSLPGIPGQGVLTIIIGLMLLDIPGKHRLVLSFVRRPGILRTLNHLRAWFGRPPLHV